MVDGFTSAILMVRRILLASIAAMIFAFAILGIEPASSQQAVETESAIGLEVDQTADEAMRLRLRTLYRDLEGLAGVFVTVNGGIVTLTGTVAEPDLATEATEFAKRLENVIAVRNQITVSTSLIKRLEPVYDRIERRAVSMLAYLPLFIVACVIFGVFALVGHWAAARNWPWNRLAPNAFIRDLIRQLVRLSFWLLGLVVALDVLGATSVIGTVLGAAGIVGLAIGFAVRDTVENYIASILLSVRQPFAPNDLVSIEGFEGHVIRLTARATVLLSLDGNHVRIPNATVFKSVITNFTRNPERRFEFDLGINSDGDALAALAIGQKALREMDFLLDQPEPNGVIKNIGDFSTILTFTGWVDQRKTSIGAARSTAIQTLLGTLGAQDFSFPEPTQRVILKRDKAAKTPSSASSYAETEIELTNSHGVEQMVEAEQKDESIENLLDQGTKRSEI